jgi:hypothetical protein
MSAFIKLHPHSLSFQRLEDGNFNAELAFSVEQYGLMVSDCLVKLQLFAPNQFHTHWWMVCDDPAQLNVPGFSVFLRSLEKFVFTTLNYSPEDAVMSSPQTANLRLSGSGSNASELFFDKMYFDIDQVKFQLIKD